MTTVSTQWYLPDPKGWPSRAFVRPSVHPLAGPSVRYPFPPGTPKFCSPALVSGRVWHQPPGQRGNFGGGNFTVLHLGGGGDACIWGMHARIWGMRVFVFAFLQFCILWGMHAFGGCAQGKWSKHELASSGLLLLSIYLVVE